MNALQGRAPHLLKQVINPPDKVTMNDSIKLRIQCKCGQINEVGARSLIRRWAEKDEYRCKSCDVKTYANDPQRLAKYKQTLYQTTTAEDRSAFSKLGANALWAQPGTREKYSNLLKERNKSDHRMAEGRKKALATFMAGNGYKEHLAKIRAAQSGITSTPELVVKALLEDLNVKYTHQYVLGPYSFDFKVGNLLIEVQGEYWHANTIAQDSAKATYASNGGYELLHLWENDFSVDGLIRDTLLRRLNLKAGGLVDFKFQDVTVVPVDTKNARVFLGRYHYLPAISKSGIHFGAYLNNILIATCTFSGLVRNQTAVRLGYKASEVRELSRFCIHPDYHAKNFASWFMARAIKQFTKVRDIKCLVSFADADQGHEGIIYKASNWVLDGTVEGHYYYKYENRIVHKKTVWDRAKKLGMTEAEYAIRHGYTKILSGPKKRYILKVGTDNADNSSE